MINWTDQQLNAINVRNRNILVSAAAGSGKTAVLVERVKSIITDKNNPVPIDSLLIVTFTNAAAAEMKSRISKALNECIKNEPDNLFFRKQLSLLNTAKICTIDAFCGNLVREHFYELGIAQDFTLFEESELEILEDSIISDTINDFYKSANKDFISLIEAYTTPSSDKALIETVKSIMRFIYALPFPEKWLDFVISQYDPSVPLENTIWYNYAENEIKKLLDYGLSLIKKNIDSIQTDDPKVSEKLEIMFNDDLNIYNDYINAYNSSWDDMVKLDTPSFMRMVYSKKIDEYIYFMMKSNRETYKSIINDDIRSLLIATESEYKQDTKALSKSIKAIVELVKEVDSRLMAEKRERNSYSFSDIEHFAINLLFECKNNGVITKKPLAEKMSSEYYEILVDEYQDTNEAQDLLFNYLSNGRNLFMVGDIKQSIYRFRLAMPNLFNKKKKDFKPYSPDDEENSSKIILDKNYRSREDICSYVNFVFSNTMSEETGELDYGEEEFLYNGRNYPDADIPSAQIKLIIGAKGEDATLSEAAEIAKLIKQKVKNQELIQDGDAQRPVRYGDFAILMRNLRSKVNDYTAVLTEFGIPVISENASNLFDNNEIRTLVSILRTIDNPTLDIPLLATMMSPVYAFTPDELAKIKIDNKSDRLYKSVSLSNDCKCKSFLDDISNLRKISITMSVSSFIRYFVEEKSFISYINAMGNGEQRYQNVLKLISFAQNFDKGTNIGLTSFLRYIDKIAQSDKRVDSAALTGSYSDAVTIMTIHKSKGLEFPICILAGAAKTYNKKELSSKLLINNNYGIGIKVHDEDNYCQYNSLQYSVIKRKCANELMSENLRVLYVAMTRAKEQFITFVTCDKADNKLKKLACEHFNNGRISPYCVSRISSDGDLLLLCSMLHQDGGAIRSLASCNIHTVNSNFKLSVDIIQAEKYENISEEYNFVEYDDEIVKQIGDKLKFNYKFKDLEFLASKMTASELDSNENGFEYITSSKPAFLNGKGLTPAQRGTAMHTFMQYSDYNKSRIDIEAEISELLEKGHLTDEQADCLDRKKLKTFFNSDIVSRMLKAEKLYREIKLTSYINASDLYKVKSDEKILVQGIADCVFEENGQLILLDYKTDRVDCSQQLLDRYEKQLMFYKSAVAKALEKPVKEVILYSFYLNKCCYYK